MTLRTSLRRLGLGPTSAPAWAPAVVLDIGVSSFLGGRDRAGSGADEGSAGAEPYWASSFFRILPVGDFGSARMISTWWACLYAATRALAKRSEEHTSELQ